MAALLRTIFGYGGALGDWGEHILWIKQHISFRGFGLIPYEVDPGL